MRDHRVPADRRLKRPLWAVVSTGRRNTLAKSLCWRLEVQRFPGPLVELARHLVQLGLRVRREIGPLGKYWRSRRLVFSFEPRCQGLCGSQK